MPDDKHYDPYEHEPLPEGEEAAPPLAHTMSIVRWALLIGLSLFALVMILNAVGLAPWDARADDSVQYHCPMHPTYISSQPGDCPICGMSLVAIDKAGKEIKDGKESKTEKSAAKADEKAVAGYVCPMHPEVTSDTPGECPKCGMDLVKVASEDKAQTAAYVCPMHPEVTSDKPGECPKCGMDLVKTASEEKSSTTAYVCPMHPEVTSDKPGECPKCGMDLVLAKDASKKEPIKTSDKPIDPEAKYFCPMHPEVTSGKPGRCPKCKMFLEPVSDSTKTVPEKRGETSPDGTEGYDMSDMGEAPVPGLVPITIEPERLQLIGVRTAVVQPRDLGGQTDIVGFVTPDETRLKNVNIRVNGWVTDLFVDETGQYVEAGKPLLSIYSQELYQAEQDFMVARDALTRDSTDVALMKMRWDIFFAARERLHLLGLSESQIDAIEGLDSASPQLMIRSPFSGYVLEKNVLPGQYTSPDQNLFTIADLSRVWVLGDVYEQDSRSVKVGQKAMMRLAAFPGETFEGKIGYVYPSVSERTRTMKVRIEFANPDMRLRPGMYAQIALSGESQKILAVPSDAILDNGNIQYAFVVHSGGHFEPRQVSVGGASDDFVEVTSGLREGELVATSANFLIDSESRLQAAISGMGGAPESPAGGEHVH